MVKVVVNRYRPVLLYAGLANYPSPACCLPLCFACFPYSRPTRSGSIIRPSIAMLRNGAIENVRVPGGRGTRPSSQLDWLISTTAMIVVSCSTATSHLFKSFRLVLHQSAAATMSIPLPPSRQHLASGGTTTTRTKKCEGSKQASRSMRKSRPETGSKKLSRPSLGGVDFHSIRAVSSQSYWAVRPTIHPF